MSFKRNYQLFAKLFVLILLLFSSTAWSANVYIIGSGNMGIFFSVALAKKNNVSVISQTGKKELQVHLPPEIQSYLNTSDSIYNLPIISWSDLNSIPSHSIVLITTKADDLSNVGKLLRKKLDGTQVLVFLQNGIDILNESLELATYSNKVRGIVLFGVNTIGNNPTILKIGSVPKINLAAEKGIDAIESIKELFMESGITVASTSNQILEAEWKKAIHNIFMNGLTAICDKMIGEILDNPRTLELAQSLLSEAIAVAKIEGVYFTEEELRFVFALASKLSAHSTSMREDLRKGRKTESPWLYGHMIKVANHYGIEVPTTRFINNAIHEILLGNKNSELDKICNPALMSGIIQDDYNYMSLYATENIDL